MKFLSLKNNIAFLVLWITCSIILFKYFTIMYYSWAGDAAGFVDMIHNIAEGKGMVSSAFSSMFSLMPYLASKVDYYVNADYRSLYYMQDISQWHLYLFAYFLGFVNLFGFSALQISVCF